MTGRAVLLLVRETTLDADRQMAAALRYADDHGLTVTAVTADEHGAVDTIVAAEAAVLLCAVEPLGGGLPAWIGARVEAAGGELVVVRRNTAMARAADGAETRLIRTALINSGGDIPGVADLLGLPRERVQHVAQGMRPTRAPDVPRPRRLYVVGSKEEAHQ